jgi:hypothetical protein
MKDSYDVIVAGSGPAGFAAAYYAATNGADTLLVEKNGALGGTLTTGLMGVFCGRASSGLFTEIRETICCDRDGQPWPRSCYDVEEMKQFLFAKAEEAGMDLLLYASAAGVQRSDGRMDGLGVQAKEGRRTLKAAVYVDATGDGDVAAFAAEDFDLGRAKDGKFQPMTLMFHLGGVDTENGEGLVRDQRRALAEKLRNWVAQGKVDPWVGHVILIPGVRPGTVKCNMTNVIDLDGTTSEDLTKAEARCRKQLAQILAFLRAEARGFEDCYVKASAGMVGVRETRHIKGRYVLNEKDISEGRVFEDWAVTHARYVWGTHNLYGPIHGAGQNDSKWSPYGPLPHGKDYTIPYRSLCPAKTNNLLLAGRCISGTFLAHSNYRVMPICMAMGQAAGTAAAMCVENRCSVDDLDPRRLQEQLIKDGVEPP